MSEVKKYRKKPVVIEAIQLKWENWSEICDFVGVPKNGHGFNDYTGEAKIRMIIKTLEGELTASEGDYIIKGIKGEFYPCKPDIFEQTYEEVIE